MCAIDPVLEDDNPKPTIFNSNTKSKKEQAEKNQTQIKKRTSKQPILETFEIATLHKKPDISLHTSKQI